MVLFWQNVQQTVTLLIILSILVVAHEWGHFIVARLCGIRVDDFSIGFGKRLFRIAKRGDTEYNVRMLPLGGFVKIAGMEPDEAPLIAAKDKVLGKDNADPDAHQFPLVAENVGENSAYTAPDGFYSKPLWQRSLVILAGPVMSFILGYVVFCLMGVTTGIPTGKTLSKVGMAGPGGEGQRVGLRIGDVITAVNGKPVADGEDLIHTIYASANKPLTLSINRNGQKLTKVATPQPVKDDQGKPVAFVTVQNPQAAGKVLGLRPGDIIGTVNGKDAIGAAGVTATLTALGRSAGKMPPITVLRDGQEVALDGALPASVVSSLPVLQALPSGRLNISPAKENKRVGLAESIRYGNDTVISTFLALAYLIHHRELHKAAGGIIFMYQATGLAVKSGLPDVVSMLASLSISLAIFNMLPIPILDGGHLLTFFIEWIRRGKRLTDQQQQWFLMTGLGIIGILFVLIMSNDIVRTVTHQLPQ